MADLETGREMPAQAQPRSPRAVAHAVDGEVAAVAELAVRECGADGLLVLDSRRRPTRIVAEVGAAVAGHHAEPAGPPNLAGERATAVVARDDGGRRIISTSLDIGDGRALGEMHAIFLDAGSAPTREELRGTIRAFARHIGLVLEYSSLRTESARRDALDEALLALDDLARSPEAISEITDHVVRIMQLLVGVSAVAITVWDEERDVLRALPGAFGVVQPDLQASVTGRAANLQRSPARVFATGQPYMTNAAAEDPGVLQAYVDRFHIERMLSVPLNVGERRAGVLSLINKPTDFTVADIAVIDRVSPRIAMAVELARTMTQLRTEQRIEVILASTAVAIARGQGLEGCLRPALRQWCEVTGTSLAALVPLDGSPLRWSAREVDPALEQRLIEDARRLERRSLGAFPQAVGDPGWAALHAPVELSGERIATLSALRQTGEPFNAGETAALGRLASVSAMAWASEGYQRKLAELATMRERERIADDLHDHVAQIIFAAGIGLERILEEGGVAGLDAERVEEIRGLLTKCDTAVRNVIHRNAAARRSALSQRLRLEVDSVEAEFGVTIHLDLPEEALVDAIRGPAADALVKVAREATVNAAKHAGRCRIGVELRVQPGARVSVVISDDGIGASGGRPPRQGHGIASLRRTVRDAGGTLHISGAGRGFGTRVSATFPI